MTIGPNIVVRGQNGKLVDTAETGTALILGTMSADVAGGRIFSDQTNYPIQFQGTFAASNGGLLAINNGLTGGVLSGMVESPTGTIQITGSLLTSATDPAFFDPQGVVTFTQNANAASARLLEAASQDLGAAAMAFTHNSAFGSLNLANQTYVKLVDQSHNTTSNLPEAVYVYSLSVASGTTLDLNGLHLYTMSSDVHGVVLNGSVTVVSIPTTTAVTPSTATVTYGQPVTFTATVSAVAGIPIIGTVTFYDGLTALGTGTVNNGLATFTTAALNAGVHVVTATYSGGGNFTASSSLIGSSSHINVQQATPTVVASVTGGIYHAKPFLAVASATGVDGFAVNGSVTLLYYTGNTVNGVGSETAPVNAGTYTVVAEFVSSDSNYSDSASVPVTFTIAPAELTIEATTNTKPYDATTSAAAIPTAIGLIGTDSLTATESYISKNVLGIGYSTLQVNSDYTINDGNGGSNYVVVAVNAASGTITKAPLTIAATTNTKVYDGTRSAGAIPSVSGLQAGDTVAGLVEVYTSAYVKGLNRSTLQVTPDYTLNDGNNGQNYSVSLQSATGTIRTGLPTLTCVSTLIFTERQVATVVNGAVVVGDVDSATLASATVTITDNYDSSQDILGFNGSAATGNINGSFNSSTGTLTLASAGATATLAQFQAALRLVTFKNSSVNPSTAPRSIDYQILDNGVLSNTLRSFVTLIRLDDAPILGGAVALAYTEKQLATAINPTITVNDADNATLAAATVKISANLSATQDVLDFVGNASTGNIIGYFNAATGTMTLASAGATATTAQFQAALRLVTYRNSSAHPSTAVRSVTYQVSDGSLLSSVATSTINVAAVNDPPTLVGAVALVYAKQQIATAIDKTIVVGDVNNTTLASATVRISSNHSINQDVLGFVANPATTGNITGSFDSTTGVLTLTSAGATATLVQFQAALRLVTYFNTSSTPATAPRTVDYQVSDGSLSSSCVSCVITIKGAGAAPVVAGSSTLSYVKTQPATAINTAVTVSDANNATLASATVKISANFSATQDVLEFVGDATTGNITGSFNAGSMTLISVGATATLAQFQSALRLVTYRNTSFNPSLAPRSVTYQASDGLLLSNVLTSTINLTAANTAPVVSGASALIFTERQAAAVLNSAIIVGDGDSLTLASATVTISANYSVGEDFLGFVANSATGNIVGNFDAATGTLTLTSAGSTATLAQFQAALRLVTYANTSANPSTAARSIDYRVFDRELSGNKLSSLVTIKLMDDAPILSGSSTLAYTEKQTAAVINSAITVSDIDDTTLASATVKISANFVAGQDILGFVGSTDTGNIAGSYNTATGTMTLISTGASATVAQFQAALRMVSYTNTSANPSSATRTITYQVSDGALLSNTLVSSITVSPVEDAPVLGGVSTLIYLNNHTAKVINTAVTVTDVDSPKLASATIAFSTNYVEGQDVLGLVGNSATENIIGSFNAAIGTLTLTSAGATATVAQFQAALRLVTYSNLSNTPSQAFRTIEYQVSNASLKRSNVITSLVTIKVGGVASILAGPSTLNYTQPQTSVAINPSITVLDSDSLTLAFATVKISANYSSAQDVLAFAADASTGDISATFNPQTGVLTLFSTGAVATVTQFQAALRRVTYNNTSRSPSTAARSVSYQASDGSNLSNSIASTIIINA